MATARESGKPNFSYDLGSEDLCDLICHPCHRKGNFHKAVGMCKDCQESLCQRCFDVHTIPTPLQNHTLLNKQQMLDSQTSLRTVNKSSEKCPVHEEKTIKYYCMNHNYLGCSACITLDHRACDSVRYIPIVAKDLSNNEEYKQAERQLESVFKRSNRVTKDYKQKVKSLKSDCSEAVKMVQEFRREIIEALDKIEAGLVKSCETIKAEELKKISRLVDKCKTAKKELRDLIAAKQSYENNEQKSSLYILMMKTKEHLKIAEKRISAAEEGQQSVKSGIRFVANKETLSILERLETFGKLSKTRTSSLSESEKSGNANIRVVPDVEKIGRITIVGIKHVKDVIVKSRSDKMFYNITVLPDSRLFIVDSRMVYGKDDGNVKLVDVKQGKVIAQLSLSSPPEDAAMITDSQVAVTLPDECQIVFLNVVAAAMNVDRTLVMNGKCSCVDYRDDKLAVTLTRPHQVEVLTLQGEILYTITLDRISYDRNTVHTIYRNYVALGQDNYCLYLSNSLNHEVIHLKFDGTVVNTYTDSELRSPTKLFTDSIGHVYVCGQGSCNIHQITQDFRKVKVFGASDFDINHSPCSVGYSEKEGMLYMALPSSNVVKVYQLVLGLR